MSEKLITEALIAQIEFNMATMQVIITLTGMVDSAEHPELFKQVRELSDLNSNALQAVSKLMKANIRKLSDAG